MKRLRTALVVIVLLELVAGLVWLFAKPSPASPPVVNMDRYPPVIRKAVSDELSGLNADAAESWKSLADVLFAFGKYAGAEACYREAVTLKPSTARFAYDLAFCLSTMGRLSESDREFRRVMALDPGAAADCWHQLGCNAVRDQRRNGAVDAFTQAGDETSKLRLAALFLFESDFARAEELLQSVLKTYPQSYSAHQLLTEVYRLTNRLDAARSQAGLGDLLNEVIQSAWHRQAEPLVSVSRSGGEEGYAQEMSARVAAGDTSELNALIEMQSVQWSPRVADVITDILLQTDPAQAETQLRETFVRDGGTVARLAKLGRLLHSRDKSAAVEAFKAAQNIQPGSRTPDGMALYQLLAQLEDDADRKRKFLAAAKRIQGLEELAALRVVETINAFEASLINDGQQPEIRYLLGRMYQLTGKSQEARESFEECLELEPTHKNAQHFVLQLDEQLDQPGRGGKN